MTRTASCLLASFLLASPVSAQFSNGGGVAQSYVDAAVGNIASAIPQASTSVPSAGTLPGSAGSSSTYQRGDAAIPITVQRTTVVTDSSGNWSVTWGKSFVSSSPTVNPVPLNISNSSPYVCNVTSRSQTAAAGKCWQVTSQSVALISLTIALAPSTAPTATSVMVIGAEPTQ